MNAIKNIAKYSANTPTGGQNGCESPVPSPCINVCRMNPRTGYCVGCFRTLDEIAQWAQADDAAKRAVWQQLPARKADH